MKIVRSATELSPGKACLAIGVFDGVHLGHQQIIRQTVADAKQHEAVAVHEQIGIFVLSPGITSFRFGSQWSIIAAGHEGGGSADQQESHGEHDLGGHSRGFDFGEPIFGLVHCLSR